MGGVEKMVFIDSVRNQQYSQYADRDVTKNRDPNSLKPVKGTSPTYNPPQFRLGGREAVAPKLLKVQKKTVERAKRKNGDSAERIYKELTGKGVNIDEKV